MIAGGVCLALTVIAVSLSFRDGAPPEDAATATDQSSGVASNLAGQRGQLVVRPLSEVSTAEECVTAGRDAAGAWEAFGDPSRVEPHEWTAEAGRVWTSMTAQTRATLLWAARGCPPGALP
jgi:hypothetical protein